jgi:hypothetical protein
METAVKTPAVIARDALAILDRDGWNQGMLTWQFGGEKFRDGSHCVGGAVNLAMHGSDEWAYDEREAAPVYTAIADAMEAIDPIAANEHDRGYYSRVLGTIINSGNNGGTVYYLAEWNNYHTEEQVREALGRVAGV